MRALLTAFALLFLASAAVTAAAEPDAKTPPAWLSQVDATGPGAFPLPRSFQAKYAFSWSGLTAGRAEVDFSSPPAGSEVLTNVKVGSVGGARALWQMDATYRGVADRRTLRPIRLDQTDKRSKKQMISRVDFNADGAARFSQTLTKKEDPAAVPLPTKPKRFDYPGLYDMSSSLFYLRSQPLKDGESHSVAVMTGSAPYVITLNVLGREEVKVDAGRYQAIKCSFSFRKIGKDGQLTPPKKFKGATLWVSDDSDRMLLKVNASVFIGSVTLQLDNIVFPPAK